MAYIPVPVTMEPEKMSPCLPDNSLIDKTRDLYKRRPKYVTVKLIAEETGLAEPWLYTFIADKSVDYGVKRVEKLFNYLNGTIKNNK